MNHTRYSFLIIGIVAMAAFGTDLALTGTVRDTNHNWLAGATVVLTSSYTQTYTGFNGEFSLNARTSAVHPISDKTGHPTVEIGSGRLNFTVSGKQQQVTVQLFDMIGRQIAFPVNSTVDPGAYSVSLQQNVRGSKLLLVRVTIGSHSEVLRFIPMFGSSFSITDKAGLAMSSAIRKMSAAALDSVTVTMGGYLTQTLPVTEVNQDLSFVLLPARELIQGLTVIYDPRTDLINLSWDTLASRTVSYFNIYRSSKLGTDGYPIDMAAAGKRLEFSGYASTSFSEAPDVDEGETYYYSIAPALTDWPRSAIVSVTVQSVNQRFMINHGDLFVDNPQGILTVTDPSRTVVSVRFTDSITGIGTTASPLQASFGLRRDPNQNDSTGMTDSILEYPWVLTDRGGKKTVAAELIYANGSRDTCIDAITVRPVGVSIGFRHEFAGPNKTVDTASYQRIYEPTKVYRFQTPWVDFSLSVNSDTTFAQDFDYWLVFPDTQYQLPVRPNRSNGWLETKILHATLPGTGSCDLRYSIDTASIEGRLNLAQIRRSRAAPSDTMDMPLSELSIPGSYWGDSIDSKGTTIWRTMVNEPGRPNTVDENSILVRKLKAGDYKDYGQKQFAIAVRMKGRFFNETRTYLFASLRGEGEPIETYFDFIPPRVYAVWKSFCWACGPCGEGVIPPPDTTLQAPFAIKVCGIVDYGRSGDRAVFQADNVVVKNIELPELPVPSSD